MFEFVSGCGWLLGYFILCASAAITLRLTVQIPDEIFRKTLHGILLGSLSVWTFVFPQWWMASLSALGFAALVWPILWGAEHWRDYGKTVTERRKGELKQSLLAVFSMYAAVTAVCWGWLGSRALVLASIYAWGWGDAAAALVGKRFGRRRICGKKTLEGTLAMFAVSFACVAAVLLLMGGMDVPRLLGTALVTAAVSSAVELYTPGGWDTITCPMAAMTVLLVLGGFVG